jgi:hypothetical protein
LGLLIKFCHRCQCFKPDHRLWCEVRAAAPEQVGESIKHAVMKYLEAWFGPRRAVPKFAVLTGACTRNFMSVIRMTGALAGMQIVLRRHIFSDSFY